MKPMLTTVGTLDPPLGNARLQASKLIAAILATNSDTINAELANLGTLQVLWVRSHGEFFIVRWLMVSSFLITINSFPLLIRVWIAFFVNDEGRVLVIMAHAMMHTVISISQAKDVLKKCLSE